MVRHSYSIICCIAIERSKSQLCLNKRPILLAMQTALIGWAKTVIVTHEGYPDTAVEVTNAAARMTSPAPRAGPWRPRKAG